MIKGIAEVGKSMKIAPGLDEESMMGPLVSAKQFDRVTSYIEAGQKEGAEIAAGGVRHGDEGYFLEPTIIDQTSNEMKL